MTELANWLVDIVLYTVNGGLVVVYGLVDYTPHLLSVGCAVFTMLTFDRWAQLQAVYAPQRYGAGKTMHVKQPRTAQIITSVALGLWLVATWALGAPVPIIGAVMWSMGLLALSIMPQQRWSLLWTTKAGLVFYSLAVIGFRFYLWYVSRLTPAQLAEVFSGKGNAAAALAQSTGPAMMVGAWLLWVILPVGYLTLLIQNWAAQPMSLVSPLAGVQDVITVIRSRSNRSEEGNIA